MTPEEKAQIVLDVDTEWMEALIRVFHPKTVAVPKGKSMSREEIVRMLACDLTSN